MDIDFLRLNSHFFLFLFSSAFFLLKPVFFLKTCLFSSLCFSLSQNGFFLSEFSFCVYNIRYEEKFTTIRSRITLTTITLCIFLSIAVSYISYSFYYKSVKQNMIRTAESSLTLLGSSIDSNIQDAYSFVRNCQANSFILNYLSSQGSQSARITASTYLKGSYNSYDGRYYIKRIFIASYKNRDFIQALASTNNQPFHSADDIRDLYFLTATTAALPILIAKVS